MPDREREELEAMRRFSEPVTITVSGVQPEYADEVAEGFHTVLSAMGYTDEQIGDMLIRSDDVDEELDLTDESVGPGDATPNVTVSPSNGATDADDLDDIPARSTP